MGRGRWNQEEEEGKRKEKEIGDILSLPALQCTRRGDGVGVEEEASCLKMVR